MNRYLKLSLIALLVSMPFAFSAEHENEWNPCESPMEALFAGKVILDITHVTTSGDGKTIYALAVIRANREGMMGKFFFRSVNGGLTWSVLNKKTK
jgi:hypothetical protein